MIPRSFLYALADDAAFHFVKFTVADKLYAVVFEILVSVGVFHKLIFPYSVLPSCGDALEFIAFN